MSVISRMSPSDRNLLPAHCDIDPDLAQGSLVLVPVGRLDDDMTANDPGAEFLQALRKLADARFERWRGFHLTDCHLQSTCIDPALPIQM